MTFGSEKKNGVAIRRSTHVEGMFIRFDRIQEPDRQTPHDSIGRACIASRGKNQTDFQGGYPREE